MVAEFSKDAMHHAFPESCPPDVLVPLDIEAVEVVVRHVAVVTTLFEALNDGQLHAHGYVGREHRKQQVLLGTGGQTNGRTGGDRQSISRP